MIFRPTPSGFTVSEASNSFSPIFPGRRIYSRYKNHASARLGQPQIAGGRKWTREFFNGIQYFRTAVAPLEQPPSTSLRKLANKPGASTGRSCTARSGGMIIATNLVRMTAFHVRRDKASYGQHAVILLSKVFIKFSNITSVRQPFVFACPRLSAPVFWSNR